MGIRTTKTALKTLALSIACHLVSSKALAASQWRLCTSGGSTDLASPQTLSFGVSYAGSTAGTPLTTSPLLNFDVKYQTSCGSNAAASNGTLTLTLPTSCEFRRAGTLRATVSSSDLRYVVNGTEYSTSYTVASSGTSHTIALRILSGANVGNEDTDITCSGGSMSMEANTVNFTITGTRYRTRWENASSNAVTGLPFTFGGFAESTAGVNVDSDLSAPLQAKLVGPPTGDYPITVTLNRPTGCSIGASPVTDANVALVTDLGGSSTEHTGSTISATTADLRNFRLRFKSAGNYGKLSGAVSCTSGSLVASAGGQTATLPLGSVGGSVLDRPMWQNSSNTELSSITFSFSGFAEASANVNVDSTVTNLKLVNVSNPASVALSLPTACSIGGTSVNNAHVALRTDAQGGNLEDLTNGNINVSANSLRDYQLRFIAAGGYGQLSGSISCAAGSLTFSY